MRFYREATGRDFQLVEIEFEERIPLKVRIELNTYSKSIPKAAKAWREYSGISLQESVKVLNEYTAFKKAFSDFLADKKVYTDY